MNSTIQQPANEINAQPLIIDPMATSVCELRSVEVRTSQTRAEKTIESEFVAAFSDLVEHYALERPEITQCKKKATGDTVAGIIGFAHQAVRGSILLLGDEAVLLNVAKQQGGKAACSLKMKMDLLGELSNQVIGRLKNRLIKYGVSLEIALPMVVSGREIVAACFGTCKLLHRAKWSDGELHALLCCEVDPEINLREDGIDQFATEGTIELF